MEKILQDYVDKKVHPNHFLMGNAREKLISFYAKRRMKLIKLLEDPKRTGDLEKTGKLKDFSPLPKAAVKMVAGWQRRLCPQTFSSLSDGEEHHLVFCKDPQKTNSMGILNKV